MQNCLNFNPHQSGSILPTISMANPLRPINPTHVNPDETHNPLEYATNASHTQAIQQIASLICQANDLFKDQGEDCHNINQNARTISIVLKVENPILK